MTPAQRRYVRTEMTVGAVVSAVLSLVFVLAIFGWRGVVPVAGAGGLIVDTAPQSLMIALMSSLVPTWLTRRRVAAGAIAPLPAGGRWPRHALVRSLTIAVPVAALATAAAAALLPLAGDTVPVMTAMLLKPLYGALLGAGVARMAVRAALADPIRRPAIR